MQYCHISKFISKVLKIKIYSVTHFLFPIRMKIMFQVWPGTSITQHLEPEGEELPQRLGYTVRLSPPTKEAFGVSTALPNLKVKLPWY